MYSNYIGIFLFLGAVTHMTDSRRVLTLRCNKPCRTCPKRERTPVCAIGSKLRTFPCYCKYEKAACSDMTETYIFHRGECREPSAYFDPDEVEQMEFFVSRGTRGKHEQEKEEKEENKNRRGDQKSAMDRKKIKEDIKCSLFFDQDKQFKNKFKNRHFQCSAVDPAKSAQRVDPL